MRPDVVKRPPNLTLQNFHGLVTRAPEMEPLFHRLPRIARTDCTVLVRGESGSGKELVARAIHDLSPRRRGPFRAINCATLSPTLLESELFGHVRGAFTGAVRDHRGLFQQADKGTLFLDEVAEMSLDIQARLLRVLEDRTFFPVGGTTPITVDVRIISASNKALRRAVAAGRFRDDLRYRLRVVPLFLPPLRQRTGDIEALVWHFIDRFTEQGVGRIETVTRRAMDALRSYPWPGNVRELRNVIEHAFIVGEDALLDVDDLTPELRGEAPPDDEVPFEVPLQQLERERILAALAKHNGRRAPVAAELGMSRTTLWHKLRKYQLS
ncbi:MAG TPA: sigma 54-interacting transcriptional regulator [Candidatus Limnocylindria bacterium]|nr:sigma 54-interacting transcriptional regulator [Candidatus Limnocylindria bacterium]